MKSTKKAITLILLASMLATSVLTACGDAQGGTAKDSSNTSAGSPEVTAPEDTQFAPDSLPYDLDFGGKEISLLWWAENKEFVEEQTGEVVDDALYARDRNVEDRLNVKLNHIGMSYTWDTRNEYLGAIRNSVMAGDNSYDIVSCQAATMPSLIADGVFLNLMKLDYLDFSKPWWVNDIIEETAIDGKLYLATGDITKQTIGTVCCMFGNQRLFEDFQLENPIELVDAGKWTIDKVKELATGVYEDINGNDAMDAADRHGVVIYNSNGITAFQQAFGIKVTTMNKDGYPELSMGTEHAVDAITKINDYIKNTEEFYLGKDAELDNNYAIFSDGRALITTGFFKQAGEIYKDMADDFWILPYPKYDEEQENYQTRLGEANTLFGITASCENPDMAAAVMEAMASEGYRTVAPAFYEVALKVKYSRNDDSARMFDLIRSSVVFDFGALYGTTLDVSFTSIKNFVAFSSAEWTSFYESSREKAEAGIKKFCDSIAALD